MMLRGLALQALTPQPGDTAPITLAEDKVFDSRLDPFQFDVNAKEIPAIVVYTDDDSSQLQNRSAANGPFLRHVELRVEIAIGSFDEVIEDGQKHIIYGYPSTDAELEAKLDIFEQQVKWALLDWPVRKATTAFRRYVIRVESIQSHPDRSEDGNNKLAMRRLHFKCCIPDDCSPTFAFGPATPRAPHTYSASDFDPLPPWLKDMLVATQHAPSMRAVLDALGGNGVAQVFVPLLKRVAANVDCIDPADNILAQLGKTRGPDGRIEVQAIWRMNE